MGFNSGFKVLTEETGLLVHYNFPPVKQRFIIDDVHNPSLLCYNMMLRIAVRTRGITPGNKTLIQSGSKIQSIRK